MEVLAGRLRLVPHRFAACAWFALIWLAFSLNSSAPASEWANPKYGFKLRLPPGDNWQPIKASFMPEPDFAIEDAPSGRRFLVFVWDRSDDEHEWDLSAITNLQYTVRKAFNSNNPVGSWLNFEGLPAYECSAERIINNVSGRIRVTAILTAKYRYLIIREKAPGDPASDPDLEALRLGFQFTEKPSPPPPPPKTAPWVWWTGGGGIALVLGAIAFLLVRSLRGGGRQKKPKRMRYAYSEKAQELAGKPAAGGGRGSQARRPTVSPDFIPPEIGKAMRPQGLGDAQFLITAIVNWLTAPTRARRSAESKAKSEAGPLKLDRRFLEDSKKEKPGEEENPGEGGQ